MSPLTVHRAIQMTWCFLFSFFLLCYNLSSACWDAFFHGRGVGRTSTDCDRRRVFGDVTEEGRSLHRGPRVATHSDIVLLPRRHRLQTTVAWHPPIPVTPTAQPVNKITACITVQHAGKITESPEALGARIRSVLSAEPGAAALPYFL